MDRDRHYLGHGEGTVAFFVTLDTVNFGSGWFPRLKKRPGMSGYFTLASSLTDLFRARGPLTARELASMTPAECARIFGQDASEEALARLLDLFAHAWNDLGRLLLERFGGSLAQLVSSADASAERLVGILEGMPFFRDVQRYEELEVSFYKRAQLMAADLSIAFDRRGPGRFEDLDRLTIFADNLVPHVLRVDGILTYAGDLAARIDCGELIAAGSPEEIEIRACALHAVELMVASLEASGTPVTAMGLDYVLWNRGQDPAYKRDRPRHRTRTVFY